MGPSSSSCQATAAEVSLQARRALGGAAPVTRLSSPASSAAPRRTSALEAGGPLRRRSSRGHVVRVVATTPWERGAAKDAAEAERLKNTPVKLSKSLDSTDQIWNADWQGEMRRILREQEREKEEAEKKNAPETGFLNFSRTQSLDSLDSTLNDESLRKSLDEKEFMAEKAAEAMKNSSAFTKGSKYSLEGYNFVPTRKEKQRWQSEWEKASRFSQEGTTAEMATRVKAEDDAEMKEKKRKDSNEEYAELKGRLFLLTAAVGGALSAGAYVWKGVDFGASFGVGVCFSLLYLRLLTKSVDGMTGVGGGPSAPSILVPVLLFGVYKRWNQLYAEDYGVNAEILPLLFGFFTYKISTIIETFVTIAREAEKPVERSKNAELERSFEMSLPPVNKKED